MCYTNLWALSRLTRINFKRILTYQTNLYHHFWWARRTFIHLIHFFYSFANLLNYWTIYLKNESFGKVLSQSYLKPLENIKNSLPKFPKSCWFSAFLALSFDEKIRGKLNKSWDRMVKKKLRHSFSLKMVYYFCVFLLLFEVLLK